MRNVSNPRRTRRCPLPCDPSQVDQFIGQPPAEVVAELAKCAGPFMVLGAGGKLGLHLALMVREGLRVLGRTDAVLAVSRYNTLRSREDFERLGLTTVACDLENDEELLRLPDAGTLFFLAGVKFGTASAPELLRRLNVEMPRRVAARFRQARIVAFSSGAVYPFMSPQSGGATEDTKPAPVGAYAQSCLAREEAFGAAALRYGTPVVLIRLNFSVEFRYGVLVDIAEKVLRGEPLDVTMGQVNVIWQSDAVAHSIQSVALAATPARPLNVTGSGSHSVRAIAGQFAELFGKPALIAGREADTALLSNASRSHRLFGAPRVSLDQMIGWVAEWLREGGATWGKPTGFERRSGQY